MIYGVDLSHHNIPDLTQSQRVRQLAATSDFVGLKVTEGANGYYWNNQLLDYIPADAPLILYHYARPEYNDAESEARNFAVRVKLLAELKLKGRVIIPALDWEGTALQYPVDWIVAWAETVEEILGLKPMLYIQRSACRPEMKPAADYGMGLWLASWNDDAEKPLTVNPWPFWAVHQYTSVPVDCNRFNGSIEQLKKYGGVLYE